MFWGRLGRSATRKAPRERPDSTNQGARLTSMSPPEAFSPELARVTLFRVSLPSTLFHESTRSSAIEGLWGTLESWPDRLRGKPGSEGRGGRGLSTLQRAQPCNSRTPRVWGAKKRGRIGPWGRHRCSLLQPIAPACRAGDVSRRSSSSLGRAFNPMVQGSSPWRPTNQTL